MDACHVLLYKLINERNAYCMHISVYLFVCSITIALLLNIPLLLSIIISIIYVGLENLYIVFFCIILWDCNHHNSKDSSVYAACVCLSVCLYLKLCHNHPANCDINIVICCLAKMANNFLESSFCPHRLPPMAQSIFILSFGIFARYKYFVKCGLDITTLSAVVRHRTASKETKLFQVKNTNIVNFLKNKTY